MDLGRTSGWAVVVGWTLFAIGIALSNIAGSTIGGSVITVSLALAGFGALGLAISGGPPVRGHVARISLGVAGAGLIAIVCSSIVAAGLTDDPLANGPFVILLVGGALATIIGMLVTEVSLLRTTGLSRMSGLLFFGGLALFAVMSSVGGAGEEPGLFQVVARGLALVGGIGVLVGCAGPGLLAVTGTRSTSARAV